MKLVTTLCRAGLLIGTAAVSAAEQPTNAADIRKVVAGCTVSGAKSYSKDGSDTYQGGSPDR